MKTQKQTDIKDLGSQLMQSILRSDDLDLSDLEKQELPAAVSHWLWNPKELPPMFTEAMEKVSVGFLMEKYPEIVSSKGYLRKNSLGYGAFSYPPKDKTSFRFIDLFAGIGGFRIAFQNQGGSCVFTSEWDKYAKQTYAHNFGEIPYGDIHNIDPNEIPDHDVLCAGFPCQPFSLAGVSKNTSLGRKHGFEHATQGTLFFEICKILKAKRPRAFFLENVKNLLSHDNGRTFETIRSALVDELGYVVNWKVVDGSKWVPQHRQRVFIVGYDPKQMKIQDKSEILIPEKPDNKHQFTRLSKIIKKAVDKKYTLGPGTWATLVRHKENHAKAGNGFGYGMHSVPIGKDARTRTISARYHKDGAEILIEQPGQRPRRLTIEEAKQLQGYDLKNYHFPVSDTQAYRQIGNSVVVPAIQATAVEIAENLRRNATNKK